MWTYVNLCQIISFNIWLFTVPSVELSPVHTGDKVERTFDIRATKSTEWRQCWPWQAIEFTLIDGPRSDLSSGNYCYVKINRIVIKNRGAAEATQRSVSLKIMLRYLRSCEIILSSRACVNLLHFIYVSTCILYRFLWYSTSNNDLLMKL